MMDEIIAYAFDDDGERQEMTLRDVYAQCGEMLKIMYFDGMIRGNSAHGACPQYTKRMILENVALMLDRINEKYADHIEDARHQVFGRKNRVEGDTND